MTAQSPPVRSTVHKKQVTARSLQDFKVLVLTAFYTKVSFHARQCLLLPTSHETAKLQNPQAPCPGAKTLS